MKIPGVRYLVGGAVRDELLGLAGGDRDWVVVGATPEQMLAAGFEQVGRDFPVFLHPQTHEEYALARTERKVGAGHVGFVVHAGLDVTLEEDLERRDFTVNAIARTADGDLIDPYGGVDDLRAGRLRHVSESFSEDPLRILRAARFASQLDFEIAPETRALMIEMMAARALDELSAERVWQELHKTLSRSNGERFFAELQATDALMPWFEELIIHASALRLAGDTAFGRFASLGLTLTQAQVVSLAQRLKAPARYEGAATLVATQFQRLVNWHTADPQQLLHALRSAGVLQKVAVQRREDLAVILHVIGAADAQELLTLADRVSALGAADLPTPVEPGPAVGVAIERLRVATIADAQSGRA